MGQNKKNGGEGGDSHPVSVGCLKCSSYVALECRRVRIVLQLLAEIFFHELFQLISFYHFHSSKSL